MNDHIIYDVPLASSNPLVLNHVKLKVNHFRLRKSDIAWCHWVLDKKALPSSPLQWSLGQRVESTTVVHFHGPTILDMSKVSSSHLELPLLGQSCDQPVSQETETEVEFTLHVQGEVRVCPEGGTAQRTMTRLVPSSVTCKGDGGAALKSRTGDTTITLMLDLEGVWTKQR